MEATPRVIQGLARGRPDRAARLAEPVYDRQIGIGFERPGTRVTIKFRKTFDL